MGVEVGEAGSIPVDDFAIFFDGQNEAGGSGRLGMEEGIQVRSEGLRRCRVG